MAPPARVLGLLWAAALVCCVAAAALTPEFGADFAGMETIGAGVGFSVAFGVPTLLAAVRPGRKGAATSATVWLACATAGVLAFLPALLAEVLQRVDPPMTALLAGCATVPAGLAARVAWRRGLATHAGAPRPRAQAR